MNETTGRRGSSHEPLGRRAGDREDGVRVLRPAGLEDDLPERERRERRLRSGLLDDGGAHGDRRGHLVRREVERKVERRDGEDRSQRDALHDAPAPERGRVHVERQHLALLGLERRRRRRERRRRAFGFRPRGLQRLAGLGRDRPRQLVPPPLELGGDRSQNRDAGERGNRPGLLERENGPPDGGFDVFGGRGRNPRELLASERRGDDELLEAHPFPSSLSASGFQPLGAVHARAEKSAERERPISGLLVRAQNASTTRATSGGADAGAVRRASESTPAGASFRTFSHGSLSAASSAGVSGVTPESERRPDSDREEKRQVAQDGNGRLEPERRERRAGAVRGVPRERDGTRGVARVRDRAPDGGHGPEREREGEGDEPESPARGRGGLLLRGRQAIREEARRARRRVHDEVARDDGVLEGDAGRDRRARQDAHRGKARAGEDDGFLGDGRALEKRRGPVHLRALRKRRSGAGGHAVGLVIRRDVGEEDRPLGERERREVGVLHPLGRARLPREVLLLERSGQEAPEPGGTAAEETRDHRAAHLVHLREELADDGVRSDVAAHDDRLAVEPRLEPPQHVAGRLSVLAPHDLERDAPANALAEAAFDLARARADDEERRAPPRADERLQRVLEHGDAAEREERRHDARAERAEGGAVAVGEEDGRHRKGIMGRRPLRPVTRPARAFTSAVISRVCALSQDLTSAGGTSPSVR